LVSISETDREEAHSIMVQYAALGFTLIATHGTAAWLAQSGIAAERVNRIRDGSPHVLDLIATRAVDFVVNNAVGPQELTDGYRIRRAAAEAGIACLTSLDTARALAEALVAPSGPPRSLQEYQASRESLLTS
jgi:carbamoyl-phosphate synthase large subunit